MKKKHIFLVLLLLAVPSLSFAREARVYFTGDIIMHMPIRTAALSYNVTDRKNRTLNNRGFDFLFERIGDNLRDADIAVGNMEFPILPPYSSRPVKFNCEHEILGALKKAGFNLLNFVNNHILDQAEAGVISSLRFLNEYRMDFVGVNSSEGLARAGIVKKVRGIRIGFIAYTGILNYPRPKKQEGFYINWLYDTDKVRKDIADMKKRCDYLVMIVHTGKEYVQEPMACDRKILKSYVEDGVDLVIGHHPHVLQPAEKIISRDGRNCYIFYSLGNFISNQQTRLTADYNNGLGTRDSIIVKLIMKKAFFSSRITFRFEVEPIKTINTHDAKTGRRVIQTMSQLDSIEQMKARYAKADANEKRTIERQMQQLKSKLDLMERVLHRYGRVPEIMVVRNDMPAGSTVISTARRKDSVNPSN
ncbi:MAG: CapA family protein [Spirochaetes bacterium]|nr:CapA family protein [Spirochaetota bacterium]